VPSSGAPTPQQEIDRVVAELAQVREAKARALTGGQSYTNADAGVGMQRVSYETLCKQEKALAAELRALTGTARRPRVGTLVPAR